MKTMIKQFTGGALSAALYKLSKIDLKVKYAEHQPPAEKLPAHTVMITGHKKMPKWAAMQCPCGCGAVIQLSLMKSIRPNWKLKVDRMGRVSLSPSVFRQEGCRSHFFVRKGKIEWAVEDDQP